MSLQLHARKLGDGSQRTMRAGDPLRIMQGQGTGLCRNNQLAGDDPAHNIAGIDGELDWFLVGIGTVRAGGTELPQNQCNATNCQNTELLEFSPPLQEGGRRGNSRDQTL